MSNDHVPARRSLLKVAAIGAATAASGFSSVSAAATANAASSSNAAASANSPVATPNSASARSSGSAHGRTLIRNAHVVSMDPKIGDLLKADILMQAGRIEAVGPDLVAEDAVVIDASGMVALPGFVDGHWHMWNAIARNAAPNAQGEKFFAVGGRMSRRFTPEMAALGVYVSTAEAIDSGITTVNNWSHNIRGPDWADAEIEAMKSSGLRGRFWYGYPQDLAGDRPMAFADFERALAKHSGSPAMFDFGIAARGPERTERDIWQQEFQYAADHRLPISTHISVTREAQQKAGIKALADAGFLTPRTQLVHATHASDQDLERIKTSGATVCLTPWTEMRVGYGLPPVMRMVNAGVPLSTAIDTLVLGGNANFFAILHLLLNLATGMSEDELALSPKQVLHWATQGGADEMGWGSEIGSITPGKYADLMLIDTRSLGMTPLLDPYAAIVQSASPRNVHTVIANGVLLKRDGRLLSDTTALANQVRAAQWVSTADGQRR